MNEEEKYELKQEAENSYTAAIIWMRAPGMDESNFFVKDYGRRAIKLYQKLNIQTLEDAAPTRMSANGVELPDIMHEDVVRQRLGIKEE